MRQVDASSLLPCVTKKSRDHPGGGIPVVDWFLCGTLHRDTVTVLPSKKSVDIILYTIGCHDNQRNDPSFTFFVTFCPKDTRLGNVVFDYVKQNTMLTGLEGCYFYANDQWNHLMFGDCEFACDGTEQSEIASCRGESLRSL